MRSSLALSLGLFLSCGIFSCGSSGTNDGTTTPPGPTPDAGPGLLDAAATVDAAPTGPSPIYPAPHLAPPLEIYGGDRLLLAPKIVTITFPNEPNAAAFQALGDTITATPYWDAVTAGYCDKSNKCIGHGTGGGHVSLTTTATSFTDSAAAGDPSTLKDLIKAGVADKTFPAPDGDTLYLIYTPETVTISLKNGAQTAKSCQQFGGYHSHVAVVAPEAGTVDVAYAVVTQCNPLLGLTTSVDASHEIIEAVTDPLVSDVQAGGFYMDQSREAWLGITAAEVADVCTLLKDFAANPLAQPSPDEFSEGSLIVQRSFSNKSVSANHAPCVPAPAGAYFNVAPEVEKLVMKTGDTKTIELTAFSDQPTADWDVRVIDFGALVNPFGKAVLAFSLDAAKANNGTKLHLTVTVNGAVSPTTGASFVIISSSGNVVNFWPGIVATQ